MGRHKQNRRDTERVAGLDQVKNPDSPAMIRAPDVDW
jgi:hypothetical protein